MRSGLMGVATGVSFSIFASAVQAAPLVRSTVFESGTSGYHTFRIPAIVTAANGDILAFAEGRKNSGSDTGNIDLVMKRSTNGGATWGPLQVVYDKGVDTAGNPSPVLDRTTGDLLLLSTHNLGQDTQTEIQDGTSVGTRTVWVQRSTNNGQTWSTPTEITSSVKPSTARWFATAPGHSIQLTRGANAGRLVVPANQSGPSNNGALVFFSDDGGTTWQQGGAVNSSSSAGTSPSESSAVELTDGRIQLNSRNRGGTTRSRVVAHSSNGGVSFTGRKQQAELIDPIVQGSVLRYSSTDTGAAQNRLLFSNPADPSERRRMTVRSSFDEGASWNAGKVIDRSSTAYSDLVTYGTGPTPGAGLLYEQGDYDRIQFAGWDSNWLDDPTIVQLDFKEKTSGTAPTTANYIKDSRGYALHGTATGAPTYVAGDPRYENGSALRFTAGTDQVRIPQPTSQILDVEADDAFTIEAVFRTTAHATGGTDASGALVSKDVGALQPSYWLRVQDGKLRFLVSDGAVERSVTTPGTVNDGDWHHIAAQRDPAAGLLKLYVDYTLVASVTDTTTGSLMNGNDLLIGAFNSPAGARQFIGDIDFVRVSSGALAPSQFVLPVPEPTCLGFITGAAMLLRRRRRNVKGD